MCGPGVVFFGPPNTSDPPDAHKAKDQVQSILHQYIADFIHNEATDEQRAQSWTKNKSKAETVLRRLCGSTMMAKIIWEMNLPDISEAMFAMSKVLPATEQQRPLTQDVQESIATATKTILSWLSMLADSIHEHKATLLYKEHARLKYGRQPSTASGIDTWPAPAQWQCACTVAMELFGFVASIL